MADTSALSGMAHPFDLMQWMRHMIRQSGLLKHPLTIRSGERRERENKKGCQQFANHQLAPHLFDRYGQNGGPVGNGGCVSHRRMILGNAVDALSPVQLTERN